MLLFLAPILPQVSFSHGFLREVNGGEVSVGLGRIVALYHRSSLDTIFTNIFGTSISEATMRPNPR